MTRLNEAPPDRAAPAPLAAGSSLRTWFTKPTSKSLVMNAGILAVLCLWLSFATTQFTSLENLSNVIRQVSFVGIAACVVTPVMVAGGLDLSIGSIVAVAGVTAAKFVADARWPLPISFVIGIIAGGAVGALNAFLVVGMRINPVITTLGTMFIGRGLANVVAGGSPVTGVLSGLAAGIAGILINSRVATGDP